MVKYINRYGDEFTMSLLDNGNIAWDGNFSYCRFGKPNVYDDAYAAYAAQGGELSIDKFKEAVHGARFNENGQYVGLSEIGEKFSSMVYTDENTIDMVDPSGGPFITSGMDMKQFASEFAGMIVEKFNATDTGYEIVIRK